LTRDTRNLFIVTPGLDPGLHLVDTMASHGRMDCRIKLGNAGQ